MAYYSNKLYEKHNAKCFFNVVHKYKLDVVLYAKAHDSTRMGNHYKY